MESPSDPRSIEIRLLEGLSRVGAVMRSEGWQRAQAIGLNPTQLSILDRLAGRGHGLSVKQIAAELMVTQPTATDSIRALEMKGLVRKRPDPADARALRVALTDEGVAALTLSDTTGAIGAVLATLPTSAKEQLLLTLVDIIRALQEADKIPVQRMCVSCRYFRPFVHPEGPAPHHCNFVDAAFGQSDLRIECHEHDAADAATRTAIWAAFRSQGRHSLDQET